MLPVMKTNSWFPTMFDEFFDNEWMPQMKAAEPAINVKEDAKAYTMEVAAPGIKKDSCKIHIDADGNLEVAVENKSENKNEDKKEHYIRREFSYSSYKQTYVLPDNVEKDEVSAKVENGVLTITMPKKAKEEEKKNQRCIEVK